MPSSVLINLYKEFDTLQLVLSPCNHNANTQYSLWCNSVLYSICLWFYFFRWEAAATAFLLFTCSLYMLHLCFLAAVPGWCRDKLISPTCLLAWALCCVSPLRQFLGGKESVEEKAVSVQFMNSVWFRGTRSACVFQTGNTTLKVGLVCLFCYYHDFLLPDWFSKGISVKLYWSSAPSEAVFGQSYHPVQKELVSRLNSRSNQISYLVMAGLVIPVLHVFPKKYP